MNFLSYLISGISLGSVYALIALGYTMVYGIAKMLNFAHGDVIMIGGFVIFTAVSSASTSPAVAILAAVIVCTVLGVAIEKIAYKPLRNASPLAVLITAIGVSYFLQSLAQQGRTVVMVLHDLAHAMQYSDAVGVFADGKLAAFADPTNCMSRRSGRKCFR